MYYTWCGGRVTSKEVSDGELSIVTFAVRIFVSFCVKLARHQKRYVDRGLLEPLTLWSLYTAFEYYLYHLFIIYYIFLPITLFIICGRADLWQVESKVRTALLLTTLTRLLKSSETASKKLSMTKWVLICLPKFWKDFQRNFE